MEIVLRSEADRNALVDAIHRILDDIEKVLETEGSK